jgi:hypothetical protein
MSTYRDVIRQMERNGDYSSARDYKDALRHHGHSEYDRVDRWNPADGAQHTHAGDQAERAYRDLQYEERREEERREEEAARERQHQRHLHEQEMQRQQEEADYYRQQEYEAAMQAQAEEEAASQAQQQEQN